jgi:hypothetical protein
MSPFGFTPDDGSEENPNEMTPEQLAAMLAQMQEQVTEQFQKLGINPAGFINPFSAGTENQSCATPQRKLFQPPVLCPSEIQI